MSIDKICKLILQLCKQRWCINWNSLKYFLAIANCGSLSGAAQILGVNHSTIFRRLNAFEKEIGGRLFERIDNRYELTSMGEEVLGLGKNIANSFDDIDRHIVGKDCQPKGTVKITAPYNIARRYLSRYITKFNVYYPDIIVEILSSNREFNMSSRQADIAVRATPAPPEHLVGCKLGTIKWSVYAGKLYTDKFGTPEKLADLQNHSLIGSTGNMSALPAFIWLEKNFSQQITVRCDELSVMSYFAEAGQGLAILPNDQLRPEINKLLNLHKVKASNLWLLTHPDLRNVARIRLLMQHLTKEFASEITLNEFM